MKTVVGEGLREDAIQYKLTVDEDVKEKYRRRSRYRYCTSYIYVAVHDHENVLFVVRRFWN